ncbi:MAG: NAD(P)-dependent oxidoreductase [Fervidicoccaceae archaeon]
MKTKTVAIGGGEEGYKKSRRFLNAGAEVTVLSLEFSPEIIALGRSSKSLKLLRGDARDRDLLEKLVKESDIVISALNGEREIDDMIIDLARKYRKLYILAGDARRTQCGMGIEGSSGDIRFAIYTDGKSSLVAMEARDRVAKFLDSQKDLHIMLKLLYKMKSALREIGIPADTRIEIHREVFKDQIFRATALKGDEESAWARLREIVRVKTGIDLGFR